MTAPPLVKTTTSTRAPVNEVEGARRRSIRSRLRRDWPFLAMTAPAALLLLVFHYLPTLGNVIAFQDYNPFMGKDAFEAFLKSEWIGRTSSVGCW